MKKYGILAILAAAVLVALPVAAEPPFGSFGGKVGGGNGAAGIVPLHGWALDDDGVAAVDIFVDGIMAGRTSYGRNRPGVTAMHPDFPDSARAGFAFLLDSTHYLNGNHTIEARVTSTTGERVWLNAKELEFTNLTHNLVPFGKIDFPNPGAEIFYANCDLTDPTRRYSVVSGWALDVGVETGDMGVGYVELLIDGARFANSRVDCFFSPATGGLSNCYGLRRLDIERSFPLLSNAPLSGFRFVLDVGALIDFGFVPGAHTLTVRSGDIAGTVANIDEINVRFVCDDAIVNEGAKGWTAPIGPVNIENGIVDVSGWALDWEGVSAIEIYVDGVRVGETTLTEARPLINNRYPGYPDSLLAGWRFALDTNPLSNGEHQTQAIVRDTAGETTLIGERSFVVNNPGN